MPFREITGQDRAVGPLRAALRRGTLHHAYLFGGPEGVGKRAAAIALAQAANCERGRAQGQAEPPPGGAERAPEPPHADDACGACGPCRKIAKRVHPDVLLLETESAMVKAGLWEARGGRAPSRDVVVDQVRDVVDRRLAMKRFEARRRFVLVDPADAMNVQAQNALLKTLEEPPDDTTIVLVAANPDALLPTVRSRCLRVAFAPRGDAAVAAIAERARPPRVKDPATREPVELPGVVEAAAALAPRNAATWIAFAAAYGDDRASARARCELLLVWLRDVVALQAAGDAAPLALPDHAGAARRLAAELSPAEALRRRARVADAIAALDGNAAAPLALERMLIGWFHG
jgi:DNA polymerase-3 subunit delta'